VTRRGPKGLDDPVIPSVVLFVGLVVGGFGAIAIGWKVAARTLFVPFQTPALVSGAMGGLALIVIGAGLASIQVSRRLEAGARAERETLLDEVAALVDALRERPR
jgi:hypothetical protein